MVYVLVAAVAAAAAVGGVRSFAGSPPPAPTAVRESPAAAMPDEAAEAPETGSLAGEVLEVIDVPNYSYLRIGDKGSEGSWAAVPTAKIAVGAKVRIADAMKMTDFKSTALNRTFSEIYFGTLDGGGSPHGMAPVAGNDPHANGADPHAGMAASSSPVAVEAVPRAAGPNGKTVAEINAQRTALVGKTVRIHATVVKSTGGVMGKSWIHLRDGSGDAAAGTNDITVTTTADAPKVGDVITIEGVVATDRDIGAGYKYATIVEDAKIVTP
jgi:hypothetical protein